MRPSDAAAIASIEAAVALLRVSRVETVYLEDVSSGRVHVGFKRDIDKAPATFEGCNADSAGERRQITEAEANAKREKLRCLRCFVRRDVSPLRKEPPADNPDADDGTDSDVGGVPI